MKSEPSRADDARTSFVTPVGRVVRVEIWGEPVFFTITRPRDSIQKVHLSGRFYEEPELEIIRQYCPMGSVFCDIGANIGNHTLFALKFLRAARAILFEPNPEAIEILRSNLVLNGVIDRCDLSHLGKGLSDQPADGFFISATRKNLGGGRLSPGGGVIAVIRGDDALAGDQVDFLKIDVEGMEMQALAGLTRTIQRCRPTIFVEVDQANQAAFAAWVQANDYRVRSRYRRYRTNENFLIVPDPKVARA